jgi:phosphoribosylformylglycinamidine cyclo-ligase
MTITNKDKDDFTYARATGVDISKKNESVRKLSDIINFTRQDQPGAFVNIKGHYAGIIDIGNNLYGAITTDGVGSKLLIAKELDIWNSVGIDCVAMNVNDLLAIGAEPVAMVDYIALDQINERVITEIGRGLNKGAEMSNITIVGGETAVIPDIIKNIDLSGTAFGIIKNKKIIDGSSIEAGDIIIGLESSGIHSNGYTLIRKILKDKRILLNEHVEKNRTIGEILLKPTYIYVKELINNFEYIHGMAHITGGGLRNFIRLNNTYHFVIDHPYERPKIFKWLAEEGNISDQEMYQTFNMGTGFAIIINKQYKEKIMNTCSRFNPRVIGYVEAGHGVSVPALDINYNIY